MKCEFVSEARSEVPCDVSKSFKALPMILDWRQILLGDEHVRPRVIDVH